MNGLPLYENDGLPISVNDNRKCRISVHMSPPKIKTSGLHSLTGWSSLHQDSSELRRLNRKGIDRKQTHSILQYHVSFDNILWHLMPMKYERELKLNKYPLDRSLTLNVREQNYSDLTRLLSWLMMPWPLVSPSHQHSWCKIDRSLYSLRNDFVLHVSC